MKYLLKYGEINEYHQDIADYERFYNYCLRLIKENEQKHDLIFKILYKSLNKFVNKHLISMTLRLISTLKTETNFSFDGLKKYLNDEQTRNATFLILKKNNERRLNSEIVKLIYDYAFESKEFFLFLTTMKEEVDQFLNMKRPEYLRRQLLIINYTNRYINTDYFFNYLGSNDKSVCYLVFEHLVMLLKQLTIEDLDKDEVLSLSDSQNIQVCGKNGVFISLKSKIRVENGSNFLIFFLPFMREKEKIYKLITENNLIELTKSLKEYLLNDEIIRISPHKHLYSTTLDFKTIHNELNFIEEDVNFDFLFDDSNFKSHSDCVEL
jgi:hypothetical protein